MDILKYIFLFLGSIAATIYFFDMGGRNGVIVGGTGLIGVFIYGFLVRVSIDEYVQSKKDMNPNYNIHDEIAKTIAIICTIASVAMLVAFLLGY